VQRFIAGTVLIAAALEVMASDSSIKIDALYTGELWRNTTGGLRTGWKFLGDLDIAMEVDGERALGLDGVTLFANGLFIHGGSLSGQLLGDVQTASNIEATRQARLFELWVEKTYGAVHGPSLRVGLYDLNSEFDSSEVSSLFINSSHGIGPQIAQTGLNGPSIFPATALGARVRWTPARTWNAQLAVLDGVPGHPDRPASNDLRLDRDDGLLIVTEVSRAGARRSRLALGAWSYTAKFDEIAPESAAEPIRRSRDNHGVYVVLEGHSEQGLSAFLRGGTANGRLNAFDEYIGAGVVYTGLLDRRPEDQLGFAIASVANGREYLSMRRADGAEADARETTLELTYRFATHEWLTLQGVIQHIINPGMDPALDDATAVALRFELKVGR